MKEKRTKELKSKLQYLTEAEIKKELKNNKNNIADETKPVKDIAEEIYYKRGIDYNKINCNFINILASIPNTIKNKDKAVKCKMLVDIIYISLLLLLLKLPFNLVTDIGYDYLDLLCKNDLYYNMWGLLFLVLYTITFICILLIFIRNFKIKYSK